MAGLDEGFAWIGIAIKLAAMGVIGCVVTIVALAMRGKHVVRSGPSFLLLFLLTVVCITVMIAMTNLLADYFNLSCRSDSLLIVALCFPCCPATFLFAYMLFRRDLARRTVWKLNAVVLAVLFVVVLAWILAETIL